MGTQTENALRAELLASKERVQPILRGLKNMSNDPLGDEALRFLNEQITRIERRISAVDLALNALNGLETHPDIAPVQVPAEIKQIYDRKEADVEAAVDLFEAAGQATGGIVTFPPPTPKE